MALQRFENSNIIIDLPDEITQGITLRKKAHVQSINIEIEARRVAMNVKIYYYGIDDAILDLPGITSYIRPLVADDTVIVDATTGENICDSINEYIPNPDHVEGDELPEKMLNPLLENKNYMYEFELFAAMMHTPVIVAGIAIAKVQAAFSVGRLDK
jgi:hypothetical protein